MIHVDAPFVAKGRDRIVAGAAAVVWTMTGVASAPGAAAAPPHRARRAGGT